MGPEVADAETEEEGSWNIAQEKLESETEKDPLTRSESIRARRRLDEAVGIEVNRGSEKE